MTARLSDKWRWNAYPGGAWFTCDRCSQRWRRTQMYTEWDRLKVCGPCLDPRPPQMMPPDVYPEGIPFPDARPPQDNPDRLMDDTYLQPVNGGIQDTDGVYTRLTGNFPYPTLPNGQFPPVGALSPQNVITDSVPKEPPSANQLTDDVTVKTGVIFAPSVLPTDPSPGPVPNSTLPKPPFYTPPSYD